MTQTLATRDKNTATGPGGVRPGAAASNLGSPPSPGLPLFVPADQLYYWSFAWQDAERKARADLAAGRSRTFDDPGEAVRYLLGTDR